MVWHTIFPRLMPDLFNLQAARGCDIVMKSWTNFVKCTFVGANEKGDVFCLCGTCGTKRGMRKWVPAELENMQGSPKMGLKSRAKFTWLVAHPQIYPFQERYRAFSGLGTTGEYGEMCGKLWMLDGTMPNFHGKKAKKTCFWLATRLWWGALVHDDESKWGKMGGNVEICGKFWILDDKLGDSRLCSLNVLFHTRQIEALN